MPKATCSVDGCERVRPSGRTMCHMHRRRVARYGDPHVNKRQGQAAAVDSGGPRCDVDGCEREVKTRVWCSMHYGRWRRHGDPLYERKRTHKTCRDCGERLPLSNFYRNESAQSYTSRCRSCYCDHTEHRRQSNLDNDLRRKREYYQENREYFRELARVERRRNPEKFRARQREQWKKHGKRYYREHRERIEKDPEYRERYYANLKRCNDKRRAVRRGVAGVSITDAQLAAKVAYWGDRCWSCGDDWEHIDHVKPIAAGGAHLLANLRPMCAPCNQRKSARWPINIKEWTYDKNSGSARRKRNRERVRARRVHRSRSALRRAS